MFCLKCLIRGINDPVDIAFEVHPYWSFEFMRFLAEFYLRSEQPEFSKDALCINFSKVSDYEVQDSDIYVDLIFYLEEVFDALLRDKR